MNEIIFFQTFKPPVISSGPVCWCVYVCVCVCVVWIDVRILNQRNGCIWTPKKRSQPCASDIYVCKGVCVRVCERERNLILVNTLKIFLLYNFFLLFTHTHSIYDTFFFFNSLNVIVELEFGDQLTQVLCENVSFLWTTRELVIY